MVYKLCGKELGLTFFVITLLVLSSTVTASASLGARIDSRTAQQDNQPPFPEDVSNATDQSICPSTSIGSPLVVEGKSDGTDQDGKTGSEENSDGDSVFGTIQSAVHEAEERETVCVMPGTYREPVRIDLNITLIAPEGATLNGSTVDSPGEGSDGPFGIRIVDGKEPVIDGFTITEYEDAILDYRGSGAWTVTNVTVKDTKDDGIGAQFTTGAWTIKNTIIQNTSRLGVHVGRGDWTIKNTTIRNTPQVGIEKTQEAGGNWTIVNTTIQNPGAVGIRLYPGNLTVENTKIVNAEYAAISSNRFATYSGPVNGTWTIKNTSLQQNRFGIRDAPTKLDWDVKNVTVSDNSETGILAEESEGNWSLKSTMVRRNGKTGIQLSRSQGKWIIADSQIRNNSGGGIRALGASGPVEISNTSFIDNSPFTINAEGAETPATAINNWWGQPNGPDSSDCLGAVSCEKWLKSPPGKSTSTPISSTSTTQAPDTSSDTQSSTRTKTTTSIPNSTTTEKTTNTSAPGFSLSGLVVVLVAIALFGRDQVT